ncbi:hypothetical protein I4U23_016443 [Adineta vaga]|nr:hypothetical protein I4U23_016443 [Adineta vaga]
MMMRLSNLLVIFILYTVVLVKTSQQQVINNTTIATCNFTTCNSQRTPCSSNSDCECFSLASNTNTGICGSVVFSCASVVLCNAVNKTCPIENTVCVNSTRCGQPICYPLAMANKLVCPKKITSTTTTTVKTTTRATTKTTAKTTIRTSTTTRVGSVTNTTKTTTKSK